MAIFVTADGKTTIKLEYTATTDKVEAVIGDCSHYLFDRGYGDHGSEEEPVVFGDLTNNQKLKIVDDHVRKVLIDTAKAYNSEKAQTDAREAAEAEAGDKYI